MAAPLRSLLDPALPEIRGVRRLLLRGVLAVLGPLVAVDGAEHLCGVRGVREPAIFVLNHNNSLESVLVPMALIALRRGRLLHFLVDWMFLHLPVVGWVIRLSDPVPVYGKRARFGLFDGHRRARARRPVLDACLERLARGESLGIFPEGTRNRDPHRLLRGRPGLGELVLRSPAPPNPVVPVVPVGIHYPAAARLGRVPRLGRVVLRVGEPLDFAAERQAAAIGGSGERGEARRALGRAVVARVMARLAELSGKQAPPLPGGSSAGRPGSPMPTMPPISHERPLRNAS